MILAEETCDGLDMNHNVTTWQSVGYVVRIANAELLVLGQANPIHVAQIANHILHLRSNVDTHCRAEGVNEVIFGVGIVAKTVADSSRAATSILTEQLGTMRGHLLVEVVTIAEHSFALLVVDTFVHKGQTDIPRQHRRTVQSRIPTTRILSITLLTIAWAVPCNIVCDRV